jgi:hypothetical protein
MGFGIMQQHPNNTSPRLCGQRPDDSGAGQRYTAIRCELTGSDTARVQIARSGLKSATVADFGLQAAAKAIVLQYPDPFDGTPKEELQEWRLYVLWGTPSNTQFGRDVCKRFPGVDQITASEAMRVARAHGTRPEIYRRLSWIALFELSSPKMAQSVRQAIEAKILAGQSVSASEIRRARGPLKTGRPKLSQPLVLLGGP